MIVAVVAGMFLYAALLVYDCFLLAVRTGFGRSSAIVLIAGIVLFLLYGFVLCIPATPEGALHVFLLLLTGLGLLFLLGFLAYVIATFILARRREFGPYDFIVVLGAGLIDGTRPSRLLAGRLDVGRAWYLKAREDAASAGEKESAHPKIVVCGGKGPDEDLSEAQAMRTYLLAAGVPDADIVLEDRSRTTRENLIFSERCLEEITRSSPNGPDRPRALIVTSEFHLARTYLLARRLRYPRVGAVGKPTQSYYLPGALVRDYLSLLKDYPKVLVLAFAIVFVISLFA